MAAAAPAVMGEARGDGIGYFVDWLFRPGGATEPAPAKGGTTDGTTGQAPAGQTTADQPASPGTGTMMAMPESAPEVQTGVDREEVGRIVRMALDGELSSEDRTYVAQLISRETGLPQAEAGQRVDQVIERAKAARAEAGQTATEAADAARRAGMYTALWGAVAMLAGAFSASLAATWGGRARDL